MAITVKSEMPILWSTMDPSTTREDFPAYFDAIRAFYEQPQKHISVLEIHVSTEVATAFARKDAAEFMKEIDAQAKDWCVASAIIAHSAMIAGALRAVFWLSPPPFPYAVFNDMQKAMAWIDAQKAEHFG